MMSAPPFLTPSQHRSRYTAVCYKFFPVVRVRRRLVALTEHFCNSFRDKLQWLISRAAERSLSESGTSLLQPRVIEVVQHLTMCRDRSHEFKGRADVLRLIRDYVGYHGHQQQHQARTTVKRDAPSCSRPLVLCGESGSGKTSVMAKVCSSVLPI